MLSCSSLFVALPEGSFGRDLITMILYWSAAAFALITVGYAAWRAEGRERLFWTLLWAGLLADFLGYLL
ncbi:MAG: hypothetical protein ACR2GU_16825 [Rubrobacteraceae bacterium]